MRPIGPLGIALRRGAAKRRTGILFAVGFGVLLVIGVLLLW